MSRRPALVVAALLLLACDSRPGNQVLKQEEKQGPREESEEERAARAWLTEHVPAVRDRLASFSRIATAIDKRPADVVLPASLPADLVLELDHESPAFNAGLIEYELLRQPCISALRREQERLEEKEIIHNRDQRLHALQARGANWVSCAACIEEKHPEYIAGDPRPLRACFERAAAPAYLVVAHALEWTRPEILRKPTKDQDGLFVPGTLRGELLIVRIDDREILAVFPIAVENADAVEASRDADLVDIKSDLATQFEAAVDALIAAKFQAPDPAAPPPD